MGNNGFSHFHRLGHSTGSAPNAEESQLRQNVEQEQQATFLGRPTTSYDPENPHLTALFASQAANLRESAIATATVSTITSPTTQRFPAVDVLAYPYLMMPPFLTGTGVSQSITQSSVTSGSATVDPPEDPFAALAVFQPTSFEEEQPPRTFSGFDNLDDFSEAFLEELETALITDQPAGQTTRAPLVENPVPHSQVADTPPSLGQPDASMEKTTEQTSHLSRNFLEEILEELLGVPQETQQASIQDNPPAANPPASHQHASAPAPEAMLISSIPLSPVELTVSRPSYPSLKQPVKKQPVKPRSTTKPKPDSAQAVPPQIIDIVYPSAKIKLSPTDKYLLRTDSIDRPYMCGYPDCGNTYKSSGHLRAHMFEHTHVSEHKCTYPECGPKKYFCSATELKRHIKRVHTEGKEEWTCVLCCRRYVSLQNLTEHMRKKHRNHSQ